MCKSVICSLVRPRLSTSIPSIPRFEENEIDWHKAYGSAIAQNHSILLKTIQRARLCHPNAAERRSFLTNEAQGSSPPVAE